MSLSRPFILRPVATGLMTVALLLLGLIAFHFLPVAALPEVDYPTIQVYTQYPGASPDVVGVSVTAPLEKQFGQMSGLKRMNSISSQGVSLVTLQFQLSLSLDEAEQEVQAAINTANSTLPSDLPYPPTYSKVNPADTAVLTLAVSSDTLPLTRVEDLTDTRIAQQLSQVSGVGLVTLSGGQRPAVNIDVDSNALQARGLTLADIRSVVGAANVITAKGSIDGRYQAMTIGANDQLTSADDYGALILAYRNGTAVRLRDVASIRERAENPRQAAWSGATPAIVLNVQRQPGANVIDVVDRIQALLPQLRASLPATLKIATLSDRTQTIRASVRDVGFELAASIGLVVSVIFLFLRRVPLTLIPAVTVPLSLIATLAVVYTLGFSLNNLTLMSLTVATGFVVDDAIVMLENIMRHIEAGKRPREAALEGAREIGFTIVSLSIALVAVLIPLLFMGDVLGRLFREFAATLAIAIGVSAWVSLTLTPTMAARMLRARPAGGQASASASHEEPGWLAALNRGYLRLLDRSFGMPRLMLLSIVLTALATLALLLTIPKGFFPTQDTGQIEGIAQAEPGVSFARMSALQRELAGDIARDPDVASISSFVGIDQNNASLNAARMLIQLKPRDEREAGSSTVIERIARLGSRRAGLRLALHPVQDLTLDDQVAPGAYQLGVQAPDDASLQTWTDRLLAALRADGHFTDVQSQARESGPMLDLKVDRASASRLGVSMSSIDAALYDAFGDRQISTIYTHVNQYHVTLGTDPTRFGNSPQALLDGLRVSTSDGSAALGTLARAQLRTAPLTLRRQAQFPYADVSFNLRPGITLGAAVQRVHAITARLGAPQSVQISLQGSASAYDTSTSGQVLLVLAAVAAVYILLGVLYESLIHPLTILSTLPSAALGALAGLALFGIQLDVIGLIGIVLLVGIVMKNAIMMVDFALEAQRQLGLSPREAIRRACALRFRPILMTTMASLFGAVPLALGHGMGAELRQPLGIAIIAGLMVSQLLTLFSTPAVYLALHRFSRATREPAA